MDTLAFGYILPAVGRIRDLHPLETCAAGRTIRNSLYTAMYRLLFLFSIRIPLILFYPYFRYPPEQPEFLPKQLILQQLALPLQLPVLQQPFPAASVLHSPS